MVFDVFVVVSDDFVLMFNVFVADLFGIHTMRISNRIRIMGLTYLHQELDSLNHC